MPPVENGGPLAVLREAPALVPMLLRELFGVDVPPFASVEVGDASQALPASVRQRLVVYLRGGPPDHATVMGILVEIQRAPDDARRRLWPLYIAGLHTWLRGATCLVVVAADSRTARWAEKPITTLQPGSPLVPLVIDPERLRALAVEVAGAPDRAAIERLLAALPAA